MRPVASPLRVSTAFGADRKAACAKVANVAKVAKKVAKVVKVVKVAKEFAKAPTGRSVKPGVKSVKLVIRRRVERVERVECTAENDTVQKALELYETLHSEYVKTTTEKQDYALARELCAKQVTKIYSQLHRIALELLESVAEQDQASNYRVLKFRGEATDRRRRLSSRLALARQTSQGQKRDALCAILAALCCRLQKNWLAAWNDEVPVRGYFAHALVDPSSCFQVAMKMRPLRLASLLVTTEAPLGKALAAMDHGGPFPEGHEKEPLGERQYAMQRVLVDGGYGDEEKERLGELQPEAQLRRLMGSDEQVLVLDVYCALAPKEHVVRHDLGSIIREELQTLLRDAKRRGQAVVLVVGGEYPLELARKVYIQPCFTGIGGLMCGYFRWKQTEKSAWEPPKLMGQKRVIFGLQLP